MAVAAVAGMALVSGTGPGAAQTYPWCSRDMSGDGSGGTNCGFVSYEQCMMTARGAGAFCDRNPAYRPGAASPQPQRTKLRRQRDN
jgi:hypothetical protein